jgi:hypothetical protein
MDSCSSWNHEPVECATREHVLTSLLVPPPPGPLKSGHLSIRNLDFCKVISRQANRSQDSAEQDERRTTVGNILCVREVAHSSNPSLFT